LKDFDESSGHCVPWLLLLSFILQAPNNVPTYSLTGNSLALQYFQINAATGVISLYKDLRDDAANTTSYTVSNKGKQIYLEIIIAQAIFMETKSYAL
jgi:hypothetical protein